MNWPSDYHMHTPLCRHAVGEPVEYARRAVELGLAEIGMSDHSPMQKDDFDNWRMRYDQLDLYVSKVREAQKAFPELKILLSLEVDYLPGQEDWIRHLAGLYEWDYLIGSVHYVSETWDLDNPAKLSEWARRDPFEVWSAYFARLTMAARSGLFDIIGHADLPKKFCFYPKQDCTPMFSEFLDTVKTQGIAIEINTAGLRKDCREIYPSPAFLQLAAQRNVALTFGSDAHAPEEVGMNFNEAITAAKTAGFKTRRVFRSRQFQDFFL
ncbi:MAG: histidinol-phosphatase HisJ family protein [Verrucomicrobiota bacterium]|nr:histidinol-phosphatase HisJ family protein [Verrucomicrobiota bacterium]